MSRTLRAARQQKGGDTLFGITGRPREAESGEIVGIQTADVVLLGGGHGLLRLDDFNGVGNARAERVPRL